MGTPSSEEPRIGVVLNGRYRITELLGEGGMGVVYKGQHLELDRPVAIKFLHTPYASSPRFVKRFQQEARAMSRLSHPCLVSVVDFGVADAPYIVMDFVTGATLRDVIDQGPIAPLRATQIARQILSGLAHAHAQGIVHRDIKPGNLMLGEATGMGDHVRIFDFGLAKLLEPSQKGEPSMVGIIGTPGYMAPEQARADKVDARADLYATGIVLFELLTGHMPFNADDVATMLRMQRETPPPRLRDVAPELSLELEWVVAKALTKDPAQRFQTAGEFVEALDRTPEARMSAAEEKAHDTVAYAKTQKVTSEVVERSRSSVAGVTRSQARARSSGRGFPLGMLLLVTLLGMGAYLWMRLRGGVREQAAVEAGQGSAQSEFPSAGGPGGGFAAPDAVAPAAFAQLQRDSGAAPTADAGAVSERRADAGTGAPRLGDAAVDQLSAEAIALADEALNDTSEPEVSISEASVPAVRSIADVNALLAQNKLDAAIAGVRRLRRQSPRDARLSYMLGDLYFKKHWWSDGLSKYREAIRMRSAFRSRPSVQRNAIMALSEDKTYARARALLLKDIGRAAVSRLRTASRSDPSRVVRRRAKSILRAL